MPSGGCGKAENEIDGRGGDRGQPGGGAKQNRDEGEDRKENEEGEHVKSLLVFSLKFSAAEHGEVDDQDDSEAEDEGVTLKAAGLDLAENIAGAFRRTAETADDQAVDDELVEEGDDG